MKNAILVVVVLVVWAAAFWGGGLYKAQAIRANPRLLFGQGGPGGGGNFFAEPGGGQGGPGGAQGGPGGNFSGARREGGGGQGGRGGFRGGTPVLSGTLDEVTDNELTLTTDFGSVTVKIDDKTKFKQAKTTDSGDLEEKEEVLVEGERDDDGNLTAKVVIQ